MALVELLDVRPDPTPLTTLRRARPARARRLRVAIVTGSYNFIKDGVALTLNRLVAHLRGQGVRVLVFAPAAPAVFPHEGRLITVPSAAIPLRPEYRLALGLPAGACRLLRGFAPDLIHVATPDLMGHDALRIGRRIERPVVASYHTRYETYLKHYGLGFLEGAAARRIGDFYAACEEVYVPSPSMAEALLASGQGGNIRLWGRGVDIERFSPCKRSEPWRERHGVRRGELLITFVSRLVREKRLATLAEALDRLSRRGVAHRVLIVGDGPDRAWLARRLPRATFTGFLDGDELATAYASSDLFFFPSDTETFGAVTLEAMASGLPTLCADATGSRSLVVPGVTGELAGASDAEAFAAALARLAADPARRRVMGEAARRRSLTFSWDEVMAQLLDRYEAVAAVA